MAFFDEYPYSNLHNVNLDWVLQKVKEWGQMVEDNNTRFESLEQANEDFKAYVTNYIENLDYQTAIDDKLDRMFESGVLGEYLQPYVSPVVTTWLDEHITEPTGVVIDTSLTVAGACADAKVVGDKLQRLENNLITDDMKFAILNCFRKVGFIEDSIAYRQLQIALYGYSFRYANLSDIATSVGYESISVVDGTVTSVSVQTFAVLTYNKNYLRLHFTTQSTRFAFKSEGSDFLCTDGNTIFRFRLSGNKYTAENLGSGSTIITRYNGFSNPALNKLYYISLENNTLKLSDEDNLLMTISNANTIGYWGADNELGRLYKFSEVEIIENE